MGALKGVNPLVREYAEDFAAVKRWFDYDPHDNAATDQRLAGLDKYWDGSEGRLAARSLTADAVTNQLKRWGAGDRALEAAESLRHAGTFAVATGQQVGLFGGPLFTVLKAVSAIKLARGLAHRYPDRKFVPVFWMATSDSDYEEVRKTYLPGSNGEVVELALPAATASQEGLMVSARPAEPALPELLDLLAAELPEGLYRDETLELVRDSYSSGCLAEGFARLMTALFYQTELTVIEPQDPALMAQATPVIRTELSDAAVISAAVRARNAEIISAGYKLQVDHRGGDTGLFLLTDGGVRDRIALADGEGFLLRRSGRRMSLGELSELAEAQPQQFVPDVALRPVYENTLLPVAAFIGGAAEIAYRAQFTALFHAHGQRMAPAYLRGMATLLTPKLEETLSNLGLGVSDCHIPAEEFEALVARGQRPEELTAMLEEYRRVVDSADAGLLELATGIDPNLEQSFATLRANLGRHVDKLEKKINSSLKRREAALLSRARRLHTHCYPRQTLAERILSVVGYLPRTGPGIIETLLERMEFPSWEHQVITLE